LYTISVTNSYTGYKVAKTTITDEGVVVEYELIEPIKPKEEKLYDIDSIFLYYKNQYMNISTLYNLFNRSVSKHVFAHINCYIQLALIAYHVNPEDWRPTDEDEGYTIIYNHERDILYIDRPAFHSGYSHGSIVFAKHDDALQVIEANPRLLRNALCVFNTPM